MANFSIADCERSATAARLGIANKIPPEMLTYWQAGLVTLEAIAKHTGVKLLLNSGYRSPELNKKIPGSAKHSAHTGKVASGHFSCAFDIECNEGNALLFNTIQEMMRTNKIDVDQLIWEYGTDEAPAWVHVGFVYGRKMRKQILRKRTGNSKYEVLA